MPHIHTESGQFDQTVSMLIIRTDGTEAKVLLHRHLTLGKYMQFGGHIELDENPWQTIIHELKEEVGYEISQLKILQPKNPLKTLRGGLIHPIPFGYNSFKVSSEQNHFHTDAIFAFTTDEEPKFSIGEGESKDIRLFSKMDLEEDNKELISGIRDLAVYALDVLLKSWPPVDTGDYASTF